MSGTKANLQVGEMLQGSGGTLSVRGCLLFKEWDTQDNCFYYWEEWQLIGANDADTWVEFDHDPGEFLLYEPVRLQEKIEPWALAVGQGLQLTINGKLTIDSHRFLDLLAYRKTTLSKGRQKQLFGRVLYNSRNVSGLVARNSRRALLSGAAVIGLAVGVFSSCTRSGTSRTGTSGGYRNRTVYGGGGGGVGK